MLTDQRPDSEGGQSGELVVVWESMACALYLARVHGVADGDDVAPATPAEEAEALEMGFLDCDRAGKGCPHRVDAPRGGMPADQRKPELADAAEKRRRAPRWRCWSSIWLPGSSKARPGWPPAAHGGRCVRGFGGRLGRAARELMAQFPLTSQWLEACPGPPGQPEAAPAGSRRAMRFLG